MTEYDRPQHYRKYDRTSGMNLYPKKSSAEDRILLI